MMPAERCEDDFGMWNADGGMEGNYLQQNQHENEPMMPVERFEDDFSMWNASEGIEGIDIDLLDGWMAESIF